MGYSAFLKPRQETISEDGIGGIIDLANLKDESRTKIEAMPDDFFQLTYPTSDVKKVLDEINVRFSSSKASSGLFLFEGLKGSGKSHLLLMIYHLFKNSQIALQWLNENGLSCKIPQNVVVIIKSKSKTLDQLLLFPEFEEARFDNVALLDVLHYLMGLAEAGENLVPWLNEFRSIIPNIRVSFEYLLDKNPTFQSPINKVLSIIEV